MKKIILFFTLIIAIITPSFVFAVTDAGVGTITPSSETSSDRINALDDFGNGEDGFIQSSRGGAKGLYNTIMTLARDLKNLFYIIATIYFLVITLKLIYSGKTEDELENFKKGILWITGGLIVMQLAYSIAYSLYGDSSVGARLAINFFETIILPLLNLLRLLAAFFFLAMAIFAFYRLVTAHGEEEAIKNGKMTIIYAIIGFILVTIAQSVVEAFYGRVSCNPVNDGLISDPSLSNSCINALDISAGSQIIINILNWINGFVALIVLIMLLYTGYNLFFAAGDEDKVKKAKHTILYIAIGIGILIANYLILTFFLIPESTI